MKKALIIGVDRYDNAENLHCCVSDAVKMATVLKVNGDGSPNFDVRLITSEQGRVTARELEDATKELFTGESETVLFYFSGHGSIKTDVNSGFLGAVRFLVEIQMWAKKRFQGDGKFP